MSVPSLAILVCVRGALPFQRKEEPTAPRRSSHLMDRNTSEAYASRPAIWTVIIAAILQIAATALPALGIGEPIGSQSDEVRSLVTPASWAFSIWGPLFAGSVVFAVYQAMPAQRTSGLLARLRWPAAGAFFGNALWALYTQFFGLSAISALIIIFTLVCLVRAYRVFASWHPAFSRGQRWLAVLPLSALAAWLTAATIVNISASLLYHGVDAGEAGPPIAAAVVLTGGVIASLALARGRGNPPYALVFLWALAAIYAAGGQRAEFVAGAALVAAGLVAIGSAIGLKSAGLRRWFGSSAARA
jgi:hypothetical protein